MLGDGLPRRIRCGPRRNPRGHPRGPRGLRRALRPLVLGAGPRRWQGRRADRPCTEAPARARPCLRAGRRDLVSRDRVRRREGPRRRARQRAEDLLRLRHRLPPRQARARLRPARDDPRRRPPRLRRARARRTRGDGRAARVAAGADGPVRHALQGRRESSDGQARGAVRDAARTAHRGRQRRGALHLRDALERPAARLRPRAREEAEQRQSRSTTSSTRTRASRAC